MQGTIQAAKRPNDLLKAECGQVEEDKTLESTIKEELVPTVGSSLQTSTGRSQDKLEKGRDAGESLPLWWHVGRGRPPKGKT